MTNSGEGWLLVDCRRTIRRSPVRRLFGLPKPNAPLETPSDTPQLGQPASPLDRALELLQIRGQDDAFARAFRFRASVAFSLTSALPTVVLAAWELKYGSPSICVVLVALSAALLALPWVAAALGRRDDAGNLIIGALFIGLLVMTAGSGGRAVNVNIAAPIIVSLAVILSSRRTLIMWTVLTAALILLSVGLRQLPGEYLVIPAAESLRTGIDRIPLVLAIAQGLIGVVFQGLMYRSFSQVSTSARQEKAALAEAQQARARFADFAALAGDWLWETDEHLRLTFISQGFEASVGVSPAAAIGLRPDQVSETLKLALPDMESLVDAMRARAPDIRRQTSMTSRTGETLSLVNHARLVYDESGQFLGYRGAVRNVSELEQLATRLAFEAAHDRLTGLANRGEFEARLQTALTAQRNGEESWHLVYLDLDHFKVINDRGGHAAGDRVLKIIANLLRQACRTVDTAARIGGDEFCLLLNNLPVSQVESILESLAAQIRALADAHALGARLDMSFGVVQLDPNMPSIDAALAQADARCYEHKARAEG